MTKLVITAHNYLPLYPQSLHNSTLSTICDVCATLTPMDLELQNHTKYFLHSDLFCSWHRYVWNLEVHVFAARPMPATDQIALFWTAVRASRDRMPSVWVDRYWTAHERCPGDPTIPSGFFPFSFGGRPRYQAAWSGDARI